MTKTIRADKTTMNNDRHTSNKCRSPRAVKARRPAKRRLLRACFCKPYQTLPALLFVLSIQTAWLPETVFARRNPSQSKIEEAKRNDFFGEAFREGRNLIDKGEWARAAEKFREAVDKNPDHKLADAALYWLAFCNKKQKKFEQADVALDRLLREFSASSWANDARVMKMEILPFLGGRYDDSFNANRHADLARGQFSADALASVVAQGTNDSNQNPNQNKAAADLLGSTERAPLDRADEIKLAAFHSLLNADPKRAMATTDDVFKSDSKATDSLKQVILRVWRNPRLFASKELIDNIARNIGEREFTALLRETLKRILESEKNPRLRQEIIYTLAGFADGQTVAYLKKLCRAENDREIKKAIINSFGNAATFNAADIKGDQRLVAQLDAAREERRKAGQEFLLEIIHTEKDSEMRRLAFSSLSRFPNWSASEQGVDVMISLYDAERDEQFKLSIIRAFAKSNQSKATRKLLDIAKNDPSDRLRLEAIYSLGTSRDPEVIRFLESLIK